MSQLVFMKEVLRELMRDTVRLLKAKKSKDLEEALRVLVSLHKEMDECSLTFPGKALSELLGMIFQIHCKVLEELED